MILFGKIFLAKVQGQIFSLLWNSWTRPVLWLISKEFFLAFINSEAFCWILKTMIAFSLSLKIEQHLKFFSNHCATEHIYIKNLLIEWQSKHPNKYLSCACTYFGMVNVEKRMKWNMIKFKKEGKFFTTRGNSSIM